MENCGQRGTVIACPPLVAWTFLWYIYYMYVYISTEYMYIYICIYKHTCICIYIYIQVYVYIYIHMNIYIYIYTCIYIYTYMYRYVWICIHVCVWIYIYMYIYGYIYVHCTYWECSKHVSGLARHSAGNPPHDLPPRWDLWLHPSSRWEAMENEWKWALFPESSTYIWHIYFRNYWDLLRPIEIWRSLTRHIPEGWRSIANLGFLSPVG